MCSNSQGYYGANDSLSPAAQFVLDAYWKGDYEPSWTHQLALAAALRAAADQVAPVASYSVESPWCVGFADRDAQLRHDLLAIAAELEGANG